MLHNLAKIFALNNDNKNKLTAESLAFSSISCSSLDFTSLTLGAAALNSFTAAGSNAGPLSVALVTAHLSSSRGWSGSAGPVLGICADSGHCGESTSSSAVLSSRPMFSAINSA